MLRPPHVPIVERGNFETLEPQDRLGNRQQKRQGGDGAKQVSLAALRRAIAMPSTIRGAITTVGTNSAMLGIVAFSGNAERAPSPRATTASPNNAKPRRPL